MRIKRPLGVTLIGAFYLFGGLVLLLTLGVRQEIPMNVRFGVPFLPETPVRIAVALLAFALAFGYLAMRRWGYRAMLLYSAAFCAVSLAQLFRVGGRPFIGNAVFSAAVFVYTYLKRGEFRPDGENGRCRA